MFCWRETFLFILPEKSLPFEKMSKREEKMNRRQGTTGQMKISTLNPREKFQQYCWAVGRMSMQWDRYIYPSKYVFCSVFYSGRNICLVSLATIIKVRWLSVFTWERYLSVLNGKEKFKHYSESGWIKLSSFLYVQLSFSLHVSINFLIIIMVQDCIT